MSVLWLYHYRVLASLKLQITEILLTFMKFFLRLLWILPARKRSFTKMSFVLRIVLVCKITTTALIKKKKKTYKQSKLNISTNNLKTSNLRFVYHWDARVNANANANANFHTLFHTHLRLHLRCYPCPFACTISYVYGPVFFFSCLFDRSMPVLESALGCIRGIQTRVFRIPDFHIVFASTHVRCVLCMALKVFKQYLWMN